MTTQNAFFIAGLGLMGGSYALSLAKSGYTVYASDTDADALAWAKQHDLIADGAQAGDTAAVDHLLGKAGYVVLALYPGGILPWLRQHKAALRPGALLTDLAGVKGCFVDEAQQLLGSAHEFIPTHPMAGRELSGVQNANDAIFTGANFLITPTARNTPAGVAFAHALGKTLGFARVTELTVQDHDQMIGYVSQLTHAIAVSLMNANADPRLPAVTGDSFRDLTRIADINAPLWSELFMANRAALSREIDEFSACLAQIRRCLDTGNREALAALMEQGAGRRREFKKQDAAEPCDCQLEKVL